MFFGCIGGFEAQFIGNLGPRGWSASAGNRCCDEVQNLLLARAELRNLTRKF